jgi:hypothetical protein
MEGSAMHGSMVLMIVMGGLGLGCSNYTPALTFQPGVVAPEVSGHMYPEHIAAYPLQYQNGIVPVYGQSVQRGGCLGGYDSSSNSCRDIVKSTIVSFIIGRDSDVMTAREIEARWNSGGYQYGYSYGY